MPWDARSSMDLRREFVLLAEQDNVNFHELCRRFGISRPTGYKWRRRYRTDGQAGLVERSRRPQRSPRSPGGTGREPPGTLPVLCSSPTQ